MSYTNEFAEAVKRDKFSKTNILPFVVVQCNNTDKAQYCLLSVDDKAVEAFFPKGTVDHSQKFQDFFQEYISSLKKLVGVCTDTVLGTDRLNSRFMILMLGKNPAINGTWCVIHRQVLSAKTPWCIWQNSQFCDNKHCTYNYVYNSVQISIFCYFTLMSTTFQNEPILYAQADRGHFSSSQTQELYDTITAVTWSYGHFQGNKHQCPTA